MRYIYNSLQIQNITLYLCMYKHKRSKHLSVTLTDIIQYIVNVLDI